MGAVRMRVQTADKNITITHTSPSVNILWSEKLRVRKKQIHEDDFNFKLLLPAKIPVHNPQ